MILSLPDRQPVQVAKWERDGVFILSGGADCQVHLWRPDTNDEVPLRSFSGHGQEILDLSIAPDLKTFVSVGGDRQALLWDVGQGRLIKRLHGHQARINAVCHFESLLITASYDRTVRLWDTRSSTPMLQSLEEATDSVTCLSTDSHLIIGAGSVDGGVRRYDLRNNQMVLDWILDRKHPVTSMHLGPAGLTYLVASLDNSIRAIDGRPANAAILQEYRGHVNNRYRVGSGWIKEGSIVYSGSEDGILHLWQSLQPSKHRKFDIGHTGTISSIHWHGEKCLTASHDGTVRITSIKPSIG